MSPRPRKHLTRRPLRLEPLEPRYALTATIAVGEHVLLADHPGQAIEIRVSGGDAVQGLEFFLQVADGGPSAGGTIVGPVIAQADVFGPPHRPGNPATIFSGNNTGEASTGPFGPQFWQSGTTTASGTVAADGRLATVVFDTSGRWADDPHNPFDLKMAGTLMGDANFADGLPVAITNGRLILKELPLAVIAGPVSAVPGGTVTLDGSGSHAWSSADAIVAYEWDLDGDGLFAESGAAAQRGNETGPSPVFSAAGLSDGTDWTVRLRVKDVNFAANGLFVSEVTEAAVAIRAAVNPHPWQNPDHPCDVNDDGEITALDALVMINDINAHHPHALPVPPQPPVAPPPYLDPSGDDWLTALDVLQVINYLNAHGPGPIPGSPDPSPAAEGEGLSHAAGPPAARHADQAFAHAVAHGRRPWVPAFPPIAAEPDAPAGRPAERWQPLEREVENVLPLLAGEAALPDVTGK